MDSVCVLIPEIPEDLVDQEIPEIPEGKRSQNFAHARVDVPFSITPWGVFIWKFSWPEIPEGTGPKGQD